jgi:AcrR family transcriptional regulator
MSEFRPPMEFDNSKNSRNPVVGPFWLIRRRARHKNASVGVAVREIRRHPPLFKAAPWTKKCWTKKPLDKRTLTKETGRKPRTDALRNHDRLLEAARTVFSAGGPEASLEAVARAAGVGIGTLYRHFPTREALFEAVYRHEVQQLADLAQRLSKGGTQPVEALRQWMRSVVKFVATKKGMSAALALAIAKDSDLVSSSSEQLSQAIGVLLQRAVAAGEIRDDVSPEDLLRTIVGMCYTHDQPGWQKNVLRLVDVFVDGLHSRPARRQTKTNLKTSV